ncbi:carotenoid biosynthesis protein [Maribacter algarum]|uniref:Carotenoid biosynthesis protein n=1 Tax=Maribacter algarum (ex Zhang et al. 2020) TaxID=2578118 RepID=A0A5S3QHN5_9FLAO|nr:carotenoid biosynthesis protein [Maribacter algarum]TMM57045.1 carotenoid biosynthesis protein [Maribacter algarum]
MNRILKYISNEGLPITFIVFYFFGLVLYAIPPTHNIFILVTPYTLVLVAVAIFSHHKEWNIKTVAVFTSIFILSFITEIIGVSTGKIFGMYVYGEGLGVKIAEVPVVIGLNWVFLVYASNSIVSKYTSNNISIIVGAASLMVVYDILLEKVAPLMNMWSFSKNDPPLSNYLVWFLLALLFNGAIQYFKINTQNRPARWLFFIQFVFFILIVIHNIYI